MRWLQFEIKPGYLVKFDESDRLEVASLRWCLNGNGYAAGNYFQEGRNRMVTMHRMLMKTPRDMQTDHINGDILDNRRCNLRIVTRSQNVHNSNAYMGRKIKGAYRRPFGNYQAIIQNSGKMEYLGTFDTEEEAGMAYRERAKEIYGDIMRRR